jgi:hypothetical protein
MARLLITDVTLLKSTELRAQLRFKGGATSIIAWSSRLRTSKAHGRARERVRGVEGPADVNSNCAPF